MNDADITGQAIVYAQGPYDYDIALENIEDMDAGNHYGLYLELNSTGTGSDQLDAYAESYGDKSYGPSYNIIEIYNISGK